MSRYTLSFHDQALDDIKNLKKTDKPAFKKLGKLLTELQLHPFSGTGKPERLKHKKKGLWSRRISQKHRLVYTINEQEIAVIILSAQGHYGDR